MNFQQILRYLCAGAFEAPEILAVDEGVAGWLFCRLVDRVDRLDPVDPVDRMPDAFVAILRAAYHENTRRTLGQTAGAGFLDRAFGRAGLRVMAIQGLTLLSIYRDPGRRPLGDLDFLIRPEDRPGVQDVLIACGYRAVPRYPDLYVKAGLIIDLHTHPMNLDRIRSRRYLFPEGIEPLWESAVPLFDPEGGLLQPDPFDNFVLLSAHALKHSYSRLIWLVDLYESAKGWKDEEWNALVDRARFWHQERVVLYGLMLVQILFGPKPPDKVLKQLGIEKIHPIEKGLIRWKGDGFSSDLLCMVLWLFCIEKTADRFRFLQETVFPKEDVLRQIYYRPSGRIRRADYLRRSASAIGIGTKTLFEAVKFGLRREEGLSRLRRGGMAFGSANPPDAHHSAPPGARPSG